MDTNTQTDHPDYWYTVPLHPTWIVLTVSPMTAGTIDLYREAMIRYDEAEKQNTLTH